MHLISLAEDGLARLRWAAVAALAAVVFLQPAAALAGSREQAKRLHDRLAGVPPTEAVLTSMAADIDAGRPLDAANTAMQNRAFYDVTLKNFAMPWTNRDQTVFAPLNDYVATVIGVVRDDLGFDRVLYDDILYVGRNGLGVPAYSPASNDHYAALEAQGVNLKDGLVQTTQSSANGLPPEATAGVMTSRAAAQAFFIAGTNRAMLRFTLMNHLCRDLEQVSDTTRPPDRVRQDVSRSPGGDSRLFLNNCVGCHVGHGPARAGVRLPRLGRGRRPDGLHGRRRAAEVLQQQGHVPRRVTPRPTTTGTTTGARAATRCLAGTRRCRAVARGRSRSGANSRTPTHSPAARCRRCSATSASATRATRRTARRCSR